MRLACVDFGSVDRQLQRGAAVLLLCLIVTYPAPVFAWENACSHPQITDNAINVLCAPNGLPSQSLCAEFELQLASSTIESGAIQEDDDPNGLTSVVVFNHFYDPRTHLPLHDESVVDDAAFGSASLLLAQYPQSIAVSRGEVEWTTAVLQYRYISKTLAYRTLGHALHLMTQDMTQPAHVHNDPHVPPNILSSPLVKSIFGTKIFAGIDGSNASPLEIGAENSCTGVDSSNGVFSGRFLPRSTIPTTFPSVFGTPEQNIAEGAAEMAYSNTTFGSAIGFGRTIPTATAPPTVTGQINVSAQMMDVYSGPKDNTVSAQDCLANVHWEITGTDPATGGPTRLCYDPQHTYAGSAFNHYSNDWWNIDAGDGNAYDPHKASFEYYFHPYDQIPYAANQTLNQYLQATMLPIATSYSAALLKLFGQTVDAVPPSITLFTGALDLSGSGINGDPLKSGGYSKGPVVVTAADEGSPTASGVAYVAVESIDTSGGTTAVVPPGNLVAAPNAEDFFSNSFASEVDSLTPGEYQIHAIDGFGNFSYSTFTIVTAQPTLWVIDGKGTVLNDGDSTDNGWINISALLAPPTNAPIGTLSVFADTNYINPVSQISNGLTSMGFTPLQNVWYWAQACDVAGNCVESSFVLVPPGSNPPPGPGPGPGGKRQPPHPKTPPLPNCRATSIVSCASPPPSGSQQSGWPYGPNPSDLPNLQFKVPGDPNSMLGPNGSVTPGQPMTYTIEFENVGDGTALGVYVKDVLDPSLDDTSLTISNMFSLVFSSDVPISTTTANFPWSYDPQTRTVTVLTGNAGPSSGGSFVLQTRLKSSAPAGTVVSNQALVYFPNAAQQITPTNIVLSAVPLPTQLSSVGTSSGVYLSTAGLAAQLAAGASPVTLQPVSFQLTGISTSATTDSTGIASASAFLSTAAGNYNLGLSYPGDGFYYLPSAKNLTFAVSPRNTLLQAPFASGRPTDTVHIALTLTDDRGQPLGHQTDEPKTVFLELLNGTGPATVLSSSLLVGTSVYFQFTLPQPLQLSWPISARFAGDSHYAGASSTGTLQLVDDVPPVVALVSPHGGGIVTNSGQITVSYAVTDNADLAPSATAYLVALDGSQSEIVANGGSVPASSLNPGNWTVIVNAQDWAGNVSSATSGSFLVTSDNLPPQTTLVAGSPSFGSNPIFVSSQTALSLQAVDDRSTVGDGLGIGVAQTEYSIDGGSWTVYASPFVLVGEGAHRVSFFSTDLAGNAESPQTVLLNVDSTPPATGLLIDGIAASSSSLVLISTDAISFSTSDAGSGVAQTLYSLDGSTTQIVAISTFSLAVGTHTLLYQSADNVGNVEGAKTAFLSVLSVDTVPPSISLIPLSQSTVTTATPVVVATYSDAGRGIDPNSFRLTLDGVDVTTQAFATASSATFVPSAALSQGTHTAAAIVADFAGNRSSTTSTFNIDSIAPTTTLAIGTPQFSSSTVFIATVTPLGFTVSKMASTSYAVDGGSFTVFTTTFTLTAEGPHAVRYFSADPDGNVEAVRTSTLTVDATPPASQLLVDGVVKSTASLVLVSTDVLSFQAADSVSGVQGTLYSIDGATQAVSVSTFSLSAGSHALAFQSRDNVNNLEPLEFVALTVRGFDILPPSLTLTPTAGSTVTTASPSIAAVYFDSGTGINPASLRLSLDGVSVTTLTVITVSSATFAPIASLAQGTHTVTASIGDFAGNVAGSTAPFFVDSIPPVTTLLVDGLSAGATSFVASSTDTFGFAAADAGTGVAQTLYALDGGTETAFASVFTLAGGTHTLGFHSRDNAGNLEVVLTASIAVHSTATASVPLVSLTYPSPLALLVEQAMGGVVNVRGVVSDPNLQSWSLSAASGTAAVSGFATLASGVANASGQLAAWNTNSLSGPFTLKLSAKSASGAVAVSTASVFVGSPVIGFSIGRKNSIATISDFQNPQAIAVRPDGLIWVSLDDDGRLLLLTSSGTVMASIGGDKQFKHPRGLALDQAADLFVADRDNNRVAKLSPDGTQLLTEFKNDLDNPNDVAVDADSSVYVADTGNGRVRVFNPNGQVTRDIVVGPTQPKSRPWGVALSTEGLWVSDQSQHAAYLYTRQGVLLKTIAGIGRVRGDAVDHAQAFYVVDRTKDFISKYDPEGSPLLSFGPRDSSTRADKAAMNFLSDPTDAAIAPDGSLWVADSGHDRIVRFALPSGNPVPAGHYGVDAVAAAVVAPVVSKAPAARNVDPVDGGKVERDDGTGVRVPANALAAPLELTVQSAVATADADTKQQRRLADKIQPASEEVQYGPEGTTFNVPVTITISYDPAQVALQGLDEDQLKVHYWNPTLADWQPLDSVVDKTAKTVSAFTTHFSIYQAMGTGGSGIGVAAADATFGFKAVYVFPNPVRGTNAVTIRIQPGIADSVEVRIYDVSGRKIHSSSAFSGPTSLDDGNGLGAQFTYDHVWDVSGVGSGVYTYVITARKAGNADIHKTGKIGVIR